ncbi:sulfite exporter TauE/SafE family protein [Bacillus sp. FJAT-29790]|uniref:sulfite exporter TauE/SafE family protein n=1 Tax=Bacillus sp. FJAT-29790 TaxID=1895002 RepID=UPI001C24603E|nr:sulfite exporter TauE/SafE family protein [Bacillus sp. FJAT-29790]MBU8878124.1 sulfite exporter TauE/SafE family protein [Bacillus sp. FJAT-29790]
MNSIILFMIIILIASILQTSTGFGFSILATPFLLLLFNPQDAIQINLILTLITSVVFIAKIRKDIDFDLLKNFVVGSVLGLPAGIAIFLTLRLDLLKIGLGILLLILTFLLIKNFRVKQTKTRDILVGGCSGILTSSIGMSGPPILLYFSGTDTNKEKLRATTLAYNMFIYLISLLAQTFTAGTTATTWIFSAIALPFVLLGLYLGQLLFLRIDQKTFRIFTYVILISTGVYLLVSSM